MNWEGRDELGGEREREMNWEGRGKEMHHQPESAAMGRAAEPRSLPECWEICQRYTHCPLNHSPVNIPNADGYKLTFCLVFILIGDRIVCFVVLIQHTFYFMQ